jgi:hypothetical protein
MRWSHIYCNRIALDPMETTPALTICTKHLSRTKTTLQTSNYAIGTSRATTLDPLQLEQPELRPCMPMMSLSCYLLHYNL